jgi:hypothetical protein
VGGRGGRYNERVEQASFTRLSPTARILLAVALTVSFAPLLGYLLLGLLFFPMWFAMLIVSITNGDLESFLSLGWVLTLILGGVMGTVALHNVVSRMYGLEYRRFDSRFVFSGLLVGLLSMLGGMAHIGLGWFALVPTSLTCFLIVLDYEYLFSDFNAGT